jgi:hypothetical protein
MSVPDDLFSVFKVSAVINRVATATERRDGKKNELK